MNKPERMPEAAKTLTQPPLISKIFCALAGADPEILRDCPLPDQLFMIRIGLHLLLTASFIFGCLIFSLSANLAADNSSQLFVLFLSLSIALAIFMVDIYIVHASWEQDGQDALETVSRDQRHRFQKRRSRLSKLAPRLILSLVVAIVIAVFLDLYIYQKEINQQLRDNAAATTQAIKAELAASVKSDISAMQAQIDALNHQIDDLTPQAGGAASTVTAITALDAARGRLLARKSQLESAQRSVSNALSRAQSGAEREGLRARARGLRGEIAGIQAQLNENQKNADSIRRVTPSADSIANERRSLTQRRDELARQLNDTRASIEEEITHRLGLRGGPVTPADGFSARFSALLQYLRGSWASLGLFVLLTALMMFIEISAVVSKFFFSPKTIYAVRVVTAYNSALRGAAFAPDASDQDEVEKLRLRAEIEVLKADINSRQKEKL